MENTIKNIRKQGTRTCTCNHIQTKYLRMHGMYLAFTLFLFFIFSYLVPGAFVVVVAAVVGVVEKTNIMQFGGW